MLTHGDLEFIPVSWPGFTNYPTSNAGVWLRKCNSMILGVCVCYITVTNQVNSLTWFSFTYYYIPVK